MILIALIVRKSSNDLIQPENFCLPKNLILLLLIRFEESLLSSFNYILFKFYKLVYKEEFLLFDKKIYVYKAK